MTPHVYAHNVKQALEAANLPVDRVAIVLTKQEYNDLKYGAWYKRPFNTWLLHGIAFTCPQLKPYYKKPVKPKTGTNKDLLNFLADQVAKDEQAIDTINNGRLSRVKQYQLHWVEQSLEASRRTLSKYLETHR